MLLMAPGEMLSPAKPEIRPKSGLRLVSLYPEQGGQDRSFVLFGSVVVSLHRSSFARPLSSGLPRLQEYTQ